MSRRRAVRTGLLAGAAGTGLAAAGGAAAWHWLMRRPLPKQEGTIELEGLKGRVRVRRDRWGVPHIEADNLDDIWFAQGFAHGQDRLWQMDFYRRVVRGRLSEIAGAGGLPVDRLMRTLGIRRTAEREAVALDPRCAPTWSASAPAPTRRRRVPGRCRSRCGCCGCDFEPWRPADILSLGKLLAFGLATNWERELLRADMVRALGPELTAKLDPGYPASSPIVTQEPWSGDGLAIAEQIDAVRRSMGLAAEAGGSNNWAVSGARSATGSPLIAGDPHLPPSMPGIWYQVGLTLGDRVVRGASMPGMPGVYMGQNNDVCWTFTNVMPDVQDLFIERVEGEKLLCSRGSGGRSRSCARRSPSRGAPSPRSSR